MKNKTKVILISIAVFILSFAGAMYYMIMNPFNVGITPLTPAGKHTDTGKRLELSFNYKKQRMVASSQYAFWIEDMNGNYIDTLYVTKWTAAGGYSYRPLTIPKWVSAAKPADMSETEIDAVSGATPRNGAYTVSWDFTDRNGDPVTGTEFRFYFEGTQNNEDSVLYTGIFNINSGAWTIIPDAVYSQPDSEYKGMLSNVRVAFHPN